MATTGPAAAATCAAAPAARPAADSAASAFAVFTASAGRDRFGASRRSRIRIWRWQKACRSLCDRQFAVALLGRSARIARRGSPAASRSRQLDQIIIRRQQVRHRDFHVHRFFCFLLFRLYRMPRPGRSRQRQDQDMKKQRTRQRGPPSAFRRHPVNLSVPRPRRSSPPPPVSPHP